MTRRKKARTSPTGEVLITLRLDESGEAVRVEVTPIRTNTTTIVGGILCDDESSTNSGKRQDEGGSGCSS